jgi:hypothetical protein
VCGGILIVVLTFLGISPDGRRARDIEPGEGAAGTTGEA